MPRCRIAERAAVTVLILVVLMCGCQIPNKAYRSEMPVVSVPPPPPPPVDKATLKAQHDVPCDEKNLAATPCLAFMEFDEYGDTWQKSASGPYAGRPAQLNKVKRLIDDAKVQDKDGKPLILLFVHGWKHNASPGKNIAEEDSNITGLKDVLIDLHNKEWQGHVVIGIYVAWRGGLITRYWPVSQQLTYWNREATAIRIGNTSLTDALIEISDTTRKKFTCGENDPCRQGCNPNVAPCNPILVYVGHSFGALLLERALSQSVVTRMEREWNEAEEKRQIGLTVESIEPLADLIVFINSAAAATESKELMDYLASSHFVYRPADRNEPLILSVTSESDIATGFVLKVGHGPPLLGFKINGSMRPNSSTDPSGACPLGPTPSAPTAGQRFSTTAYARVCFEPPADTVPREQYGQLNSTIKCDVSQSDYYMSTTAHMAALWSHDVTEITPNQATPPPVLSLPDPGCVRGGVPGAYETCNIGHHYYAINPVKGRCNGTPYWAIQMPKEVVPDHNTIFTDRLLQFLLPFIPTPERTPYLLKAM